jgi:hypothetical protein
MAIEAAEVLITDEDYLLSKPHTTRIEVKRLFDDEAFTYDENITVTVWAEYQFLSVSTGTVVKDEQWREYLIAGDNDVPQDVVLYHEARLADAIYVAGPSNIADFYSVEPTLPDDPA